MRTTLLFLLTLLLSGCAAKRIIVKNADTLLSHQLTKRLPLYSKQEDKLDQDIDHFLNDSKPLAQSILPIIDEIELKDGPKVRGQYEKLEKFFANLSSEFSLLMSRYMAQLDGKQQKDFFETLDDENRELLKRNKNNEEMIDKIDERVEMFFGSIKGPQKQLVRDYSDYFRSRSQLRLERRVKLHQEFRNIYNQNISESGRATMFHEAFTNYQKEAAKGNKNIEMLKKFLPTVSDDQREFFRKQLGEVKELLKYFLSVDY